MSNGNGRSERRRLDQLASARMDAVDLARLDATAARYGMQRGEYIRRVLKQSVEMTPEMRFLAEEIGAAKMIVLEIEAAGKNGDLKLAADRVEAAKAGMADRMFARFQARLVKGE